ncbi:MAG: 4-(cytidine 5'-diphospho)-2-C-methyl-D-erythritol kinase [Pseudomonadota bacterium]
MSAPVSRLARAKINLSLRVVGRRPPGDAKAGYHELDSLVVFAEAGDRLQAAQADSLDLQLTGPFASALTAEPNNLVLRAARALAEHLGRVPAARLILDKQLPVASGIGGGSADAAATLQALLALWAVEVPEQELAELALPLGADLPVCLASRACRVTGIGEGLEDLPVLPPAWVLLANPGQGLATPAVFAARQGAFSTALPPPSSFASAKALADFAVQASNDLTEAASTLCPAIPPLLSALRGLEGCLAAGLSGSGATCWALFAAPEPAQAGARRIAQDRLAPWSLAAPLSRSL